MNYVKNIRTALTFVKDLGVIEEWDRRLLNRIEIAQSAWVRWVKSHSSKVSAEVLHTQATRAKIIESAAPDLAKTLRDIEAIVVAMKDDVTEALNFLRDGPFRN